MPSILKIADSGKPNLLATVLVERRLRVPVGIASADTAEVMEEFIGAIRGRLLTNAVKVGNGWTYEFTVPRSDNIPDGTYLRRVLEKMLAVYTICIEHDLYKGAKSSSSFFDIDQSRPNVTSQIMRYCLKNPNTFTRRLIGIVRLWLTDELRIKQNAVREQHDDDILVGPPRPSRRELRELENTVTTRRAYLNVIDLFEAGDYEQALDVALENNF